LRVSTGQLLLLAVILAMIALLAKFYFAGETRKLVARDARIFFWVAGLVILGMLVSLGLGAGRQLSQDEIVEQFYKVYYSPERLKTTFLGVASLQYPTDNWAMQELIAEINPDFVIETGTNAGGTALFYATILEKLNDHSKVITVDVGGHDPAVLKFPTWKERVVYIRGSSVSDEVFEKIRARVEGRKVLVTLDSLHTKDHVLKEMKLYSQLVSLNSYMVVQDTQLMGHPIPLSIYTHEGKEGPWEAVQEFMATDKNFVIDRSRERFLLTAYPSGYLKRVK
jgi:cephalosporin hydroxylase